MEQKALVILHNAPGYLDQLMSDVGRLTYFFPCSCTPLLGTNGPKCNQTVMFI